MLISCVKFNDDINPSRSLRRGELDMQRIRLHSSPIKRSKRHTITVCKLFSNIYMKDDEN